MFALYGVLNEEDPVFGQDPPAALFKTLKEAEDAAERAYFAEYFISYQIYGPDDHLCMERVVRDGKRQKIDYINAINFYKRK